jgi:Protein of unknown function (DUF4231)
MDDLHYESIESGGPDGHAYLKERVQDQIAWYDRKSTFNKRCFVSLRAIEMASAASVPFLSGFTGAPWISGTVGVVGIIITVCAGMTNLCQFQKSWIEYRTTAESLKKEKFLFVTRTQPYNGDDAFSIFVQRVENMVSKEVVVWAQYLTKSDPGKEAHIAVRAQQARI